MEIIIGILMLTILFGIGLFAGMFFGWNAAKRNYSAEIENLKTRLNIADNNDHSDALGRFTPESSLGKPF